MIRNDINDYINETSMRLTKETTIDKNFIENFFRSNIEDNQLVPFIFDSDIDSSNNSYSGFITEKPNDKLFVKKKIIVPDEFGNEKTKLLLFELKGYTKDGNSIYVARPTLGLTDSRGNKIIEFNNSSEPASTFIKENMIKRNTVIVDKLLETIDSYPKQYSDIDNDVVIQEDSKTQQDLIELFNSTKVPQLGDVVTLEFYFEKEDKKILTKTKIVEFEKFYQGGGITKDNQGNVIEERQGTPEYFLTLEKLDGSRKYEVSVSEDGYIQQFLGKNNKLAIGTNNYITEFDINNDNFLQENGINSIEDIKNLTEEQQGELLKKYCNK